MPQTLIDTFPLEAAHPAVESADGWSCSYTLLRSWTASLAAQLRGLLPRPGARIAISLPPGPVALIAFLAAAEASAAAPLNPAYSHDEFAFYLEDCDAGLLVTGEDLLQSPAVAAADGRCAVAMLRLQADGSPELIAGPSPGGHDTGRVNGTALVLHTSGTTSRPKRVPLTHANLIASARTIAATYELTEQDRSLCVMPLFHVHGLIASCLATLVSGGGLLLPGRFTPAQFRQSLRESRPTWYSAVPTLHQLALGRSEAEEVRQVAGSLRFIRSCSSALPASLMHRMEEVYNVPVLEAYGMTEASHQMASNPLPPGDRKADSVGRATGVQIAILDTEGALAQRGGTGEVVIQGPGVTAGYEGSPEANAAAFHEGWFRTGDLGRIDPQGYLFLSGRLKEMINRGGEKIAPREIDDALLAHPAVAEAVAFGLPHAVWGEEVAAAVVLAAEASERELQRHCRELLADFKCPRRLFIVDAIPRTATGKIQRRAVAAAFQETGE